MLTAVQIRALVIGIVSANNVTKQALGQRFAAFLGLIPGPRGPDDGVDGWLEHNGLKIHFQSKLSAGDLDMDEARKYYADLKHHKPHVSIMLAGVGFKTTFTKRLFSYADIKGIQVHLLTLRDLFQETDEYRRAVECLPTLAGLGKIARLLSTPEGARTLDSVSDPEELPSGPNGPGKA